MQLPHSRFEFEAVVGENFSFVLANEQRENLTFTGTAGEYTLNRSGMSEPYTLNFGAVRYAQCLEPTGPVRIFVDHLSVEIFYDGGKTVFTARFFLRGTLMLRTQGLDGTLYMLKKAVWTSQAKIEV